jgi:L-arabinose isomerase
LLFSTGSWTRINDFAPRVLRVGLVSVYFSLFDEQMPPDFRQSLDDVAKRYAQLLAAQFDVVYPGLIASEDEGRKANELLRAEPLDVVVVAPTMAAPPSYGMLALEEIVRPIVIWNAPSIARLGENLEHAEAALHTTQVGCVMLTNALIRRGVSPTVVTALPDDDLAMQRLFRIVRASALASILRAGHCLRIGDPISGYLDVESTRHDLARLGLSEVTVSADQLGEEMRTVSTADAQSLLSSLAERGWSTSKHDEAERSARLAIAMFNIATNCHAVCGTVNCHGPCFRWSPTVGITACLGVSLLTVFGIPFSCTGDQPTAIALLLAKVVSGRALYCEFYTPEADTGLMLVAAGGEGDPSWAATSSRIQLRPNRYYPGVGGEGTAVEFGVRQGAATALSLSPIGDTWRLVWATGEVVESRYPQLGGPNGMFRFDSGSAIDAGARWIAAGATHHNALAAGRLEDEVPTLGRALGLDLVRV